MSYCIIAWGQEVHHCLSGYSMAKYEIFSHTAGICLKAKEIYSSFDLSKKTVLYEGHAPKGDKTQHLFTIQINTTLSNLHLLHPLEGSSKE